MKKYLCVDDSIVSAEIFLFLGTEEDFHEVTVQEPQAQTDARICRSA